MKSAASPEFQIIRPASLQFLLRCGGVPSHELVRRIEATGRAVSHYSKEVIACFGHEPEEREVLVAAPLLYEWFTKSPTTDAIYAEAKNRRLLELHPSVGLHVAVIYAEQPENERIRIGHKPIKVLAHGGNPSVLHVDHDERGLCFHGCRAHPDTVWDLGRRWAFEVPASEFSELRQ